MVSYEIPIVNISAFQDGNIKQKTNISDEFDRACSEIGFLVIEGHGVSQDLIRDMYKVSHKFFMLPYWEKMANKMPSDRYRGYTAFGNETLALSLDNETPYDLKESYSCGPFNVEYDEYHFGPDGERFFAPNIWPNHLVEMQEVWEKYYSEMENLASRLMKIFANALKLPEDWFQNKIDKQIANFSAIHYPPQTKMPIEGQLRGGEHTDYGSLTIVHTNSDIGGLEVFCKGVGWIPVPYMRDAFIINLGDLMAEWTNDRWVSTLHRVANPPSGNESHSKTSLCFFHQPNYDSVIECIPTCFNADHPPRYDSITSGLHVTQKVMKHRNQES